MGEIVQDVEPADALLCQQVHGMGVAFLEHGGQDVAAIDRCLPRSLCLQGGAFEHTLERRRRGWLGSSTLREGLDTLGQELFQLVPEDSESAATMLEHLTAGFFVEKGIEQMLQRHIFVTPLQRLVEGAM